MNPMERRCQIMRRNSALIAAHLTARYPAAKVTCVMADPLKGPAYMDVSLYYETGTQIMQARVFAHRDGTFRVSVNACLCDPVAESYRDVLLVGVDGLRAVPDTLAYLNRHVTAGFAAIAVSVPA